MKHDDYKEDDSPVRFVDREEYQNEVNAFEETWRAEPKPKNKKKRRKDKKPNKRNIDAFELDKLDEEDRRKAYESELQQTDEIRRARDDIKHKEQEKKYTDQLEKESKRQEMVD